MVQLGNRSDDEMRAVLIRWKNDLGTLHAELDPPLHVACATCNTMPFHNEPVSGVVGKDQGLGNDRQYCQVFQHLG